MIPEACDDARDWAGFVTVIGTLVALYPDETVRLT
jgi:hypothetical protein